MPFFRRKPRQITLSVTDTTAGADGFGAVPPPTQTAELIRRLRALLTSSKGS